jgi:tryptophan halogenase
MKYVIVGGGTAGWLTALFLNKTFPDGEVTVIADSKIGILGAGEGTTPQFVDFIKRLDITPEDLFANAKATIKNGIKFTNWNGDEDYYYHRFTNNLSALHFDARLLAAYLQKISLERGVKLIDDEVISIEKNESNNVSGFKLKSNNFVPADFVFDCSGFRRLIIGEFYGVKWNDYSNIVPAKRAIPFFLENDNINLPPYTESIALKYGWMWKIPVQGRYGCGYVFDSNLTTDEEALKEIEDYVGHKVTPPKIFNFRAGTYDLACVNNCIAIGLSSGFIEPLEATSIWVQVFALELFLEHQKGIIEGDVAHIKQYNDKIKLINDDILNFIYFHYITKRKDTNFWKQFVSNNSVPTRIKNILELKNDPDDEFFEEFAVKHRSKFFSNMSWFSIGEGTKLFNTNKANIKVL